MRPLWTGIALRPLGTAGIALGALRAGVALRTRRTVGPGECTEHEGRIAGLVRVERESTRDEWTIGEPLHMQMDRYNNGLLCAPHRN